MIKSAIWLAEQMSGAVPPHPQPQVGAPTGQGLSVFDLWAPQVLRDRSRKGRIIWSLKQLGI